MRTISLPLTLALAGLLTSGCSTVGSSRQGQASHTPSIGGLCPLSSDPTLQDAQRVVLDLEMKYAQAQYDLDAAKIHDRQDDLLQKQNDVLYKNDSKRLAKINDQIQDMERDLALCQQRLSYRIQWVDALRVSDCWGAKIAEDSLHRLR